jgi:hypothetical protein
MVAKILVSRSSPAVSQASSCAFASSLQTSQLTRPPQPPSRSGTPYNDLVEYTCADTHGASSNIFVLFALACTWPLLAFLVPPNNEQSERRTYFRRDEVSLGAIATLLCIATSSFFIKPAPPNGPQWLGLGSSRAGMAKSGLHQMANA